MKWKLKALVVAAAFAAAAPASAAITDSFGPSGAELFLTVIDTTGERSYTRDLGIEALSFNGSAPLSFAADTTFSTFLAGTANPASLVWNIGAAFNNFADPIVVLTTAAAMPGASGAAPTLTNQQLSNLPTSQDQFLSAQNGLGDHPSVANGSNIDTKAADPDGWGGGAFWGANWGGAANFLNTALIGQSNSFFQLMQTSDGLSFTRSLWTEFVGNWTLASNGDLTYSSAPAAVPVPAAVWLLGSGLFGLVGVARRRKLQAA